MKRNRTNWNYTAGSALYSGVMDRLCCKVSALWSFGLRGVNFLSVKHSLQHLELHETHWAASSLRGSWSFGAKPASFWHDSASYMLQWWCFSLLILWYKYSLVTCGTNNNVSEQPGHFSCAILQFVWFLHTLHWPQSTVILSFLS